MANKNAFAPFEMDFSKMDFTKIFSDYRMPGIDFDSLMAAQRKNIEAVTLANRVAMEGMQAVAQRQAEILRQTMEEASKVAQELMVQGSPEDRLAKQTDVAKIAMEKALTNMRELSEMVTKSNNEAFSLINKRVADSLEELKKVMQSAPKK